MPTTVQTPVVAVFEQRGSAIAAIDELEHAGFRHDQIGLATPGEPAHEATSPTHRREEEAADGAAAGAVTGGVAGALGGALAAALIPGVGPVLAGGFLAGILAGTVGGAAAGATLGSWIGPFIAMGISQDDMHRYGRELQAGRTIVIVKPEDRRDEAERILHDHGGH